MPPIPKRRKIIMEVHCASLVWSLRRTLQSSCEEAGIVAPIYTWERWQSCCILHELPHPAGRTWEAGLSSSSSSSLLPTASNEVRMGLLGP